TFAYHSAGTPIDQRTPPHVAVVMVGSEGCVVVVVTGVWGRYVALRLPGDGVRTIRTTTCQQGDASDRKYATTRTSLTITRSDSIHGERRSCKDRSAQGPTYPLWAPRQGHAWSAITPNARPPALGRYAHGSTRQSASCPDGPPTRPTSSIPNLIPCGETDLVL